MRKGINFHHGTYGYRLGCKCDVCRKAKNDWQKAYLKRKPQRHRVARSDGTVPHGYAGYANYKCRCDICTTASTAYTRKYQKRVVPSAPMSGQIWTGPEMEIAMRDDLTTTQAALLLGRSWAAVASVRARIRRNPRDDILWGVGPGLGVVPVQVPTPPDPRRARDVA